MRVPPLLQHVWKVQLSPFKTVTSISIQPVAIGFLYTIEAKSRSRVTQNIHVDNILDSALYNASKFDPLNYK